MKTNQIQWNPTTEEKFFDMLCVLPPEIHEKGCFLVGEPKDHQGENGAARFNAFRELKKNVFEEANRPLTIEEFKQEIQS